MWSTHEGLMVDRSFNVAISFGLQHNGVCSLPDSRVDAGDSKAASYGGGSHRVAPQTFHATTCGKSTRP